MELEVQSVLMHSTMDDILLRSCHLLSEPDKCHPTFPIINFFEINYFHILSIYIYFFCLYDTNQNLDKIIKV